MRGDELAAFDDAMRRGCESGAGRHHGAGAERAAAMRNFIGIAADDAYLIGRQTEILRCELLEHRLVALAVRVADGDDGATATGIEADLDRLLHGHALRTARAL